MSDETNGGVDGRRAMQTTDGQAVAAAMSQNVPECPIRAERISAPDAQVPAGLGDAQLRAIELLLLGTPLVDVARECGVDRRTVYRWRHDDRLFRAELERDRREMWATNMDRMRMLIGRSLDVLEEELDEEHPRSRMWAARTVLNQTGLRKLVLNDAAESAE